MSFEDSLAMIAIFLFFIMLVLAFGIGFMVHNFNRLTEVHLKFLRAYRVAVGAAPRASALDPDYNPDLPAVGQDNNPLA